MGLRHWRVHRIVSPSRQGDRPGPVAVFGFVTSGWPHFPHGQDVPRLWDSPSAGYYAWHTRPALAQRLPYPGGRR